MSMYVIRKKVPGALTYQFLLDIPKRGDLQFGSLEHFLSMQLRGARLVTFQSVSETQDFKTAHLSRCGHDTFICGINFRVNGISFFPVAQQP